MKEEWGERKEEEGNHRGGYRGREERRPENLEICPRLFFQWGKEWDCLKGQEGVVGLLFVLWWDFILPHPLPPKAHILNLGPFTLAH